MNYFTADQHFFHRNILAYSNRPFNSLEEMHHVIIKNWNQIIRNKDIVYILGDFSFGKEEETKWILNQLNGRIKFVFGNHDKIIRKLQFKIGRIEEYNNYLEINIDKIPIILFHYPIERWNRQNYGSIHLHGHSHGTSQKVKNRYDVGVDCWNFRPVNLRQIIVENNANLG